MPAPANERNKKSRERKKEQGLIRKEVWILPEYEGALKIIQLAFQAGRHKVEYFEDMSIEITFKEIKDGKQV